MSSFYATACLFFGDVARSDVVLTEATNISVDAATDGRLATDILGNIWLLPRVGGEAVAITSETRPARRPRWSPDDKKLVYESNSTDGVGIGLYDIDGNTSQILGQTRFVNRHPDWHPDGERVVFSSDRRDSGFDIWEIDVATGLTFRLTNLPGDESEPAWSAHGRSLVYVREFEDSWSLMLRRRGRADEVLTQSTSRLRAPSWRPDGSLITYLRHTEDGWQVWMSVLSQPRLHRLMFADGDLFLAPLAWFDRLRMVYTANGQIRLRRFNSWTSSNIPFRARVDANKGDVQAAATTRELPPIDEPSGITVIRGARLFDGVSDDYLTDHDIVINGGQIAAVEQQRNRADDGVIVFDLGKVTILPGYIDVYARLPDTLEAADGPLLLSFGVTTLVSSHPELEQFNQLWTGREVPGPRLLATAPIDDSDRDQDTETGAKFLMDSDSRPLSPAGRRYQDMQTPLGSEATSFVSGLADSATPGIADIWASRQAKQMGPEPSLRRRFAEKPVLDHVVSGLVLGSFPNGIAAGPGLHAEFRALAAAGLNGTQTLKTAGVNAAASLGLGLRLGRIAPGAAADLVIVDGDPLNDIGDTLKIIGVVRNGRFYSLSGLIDRSLAAQMSNKLTN